MRSAERVFVYGGLCLALCLAAGKSVPMTGTKAVAGNAALVLDPPNAKIATCDVYKIADKLLQGDRFTPAITAERERLKKELEPLEQELTVLQEKLKDFTPDTKDPVVIENARNYQRKQQEYRQKNGKTQEDFEGFVAAKWLEAYQLVRTSSEGIAKDLGYSHVVACRGKDEKITTTKIQDVIQAVLARPIINMPDGSDITEDVIKDLKLQ